MTDHVTPGVDLGEMEFEDDQCGGRLLGSVDFGDVPMHVAAIRVHKAVRRDLIQGFDYPTMVAWHEHEDPPEGEHCYCGDVFGRIYAIDPDDHYRTTEIPGREGDWLLAATPYKE